MPQRWNNSALIRKEQIESGLDITFNDVFKPIFLDFAKNSGDKPCVEIGAGTGHLALEMSKYLTCLTAIEPSLGMYEVAKDVLAASDVKLINCPLSEMPAEVKYPLGYSHLVAHCVADLPGFLRDVALHLEVGATFLFSIPHPSFYNAYKHLWAEGYCYMSLLSKEISFSITKDPAREIANVPYHHRPLSYYFNEIIAAGLRIENFDEVFPCYEIQKKYGERWETPRYCLFLCRRS